MRSRRRSQEGQTMVMFALFIALALGAVMLGGVGLTEAFAEYHTVDVAAIEAAQEGAGQLDTNSVYNGGFSLNADAATAVCQTAGSAQLTLGPSLYSSPSVGCTVSGNTVTATVSVRAPVVFFVSLPLSSTHSSHLAYGRDTPLTR